MATKFQIKRTSTTGRTPNTTNSANTGYIAGGELAINLTDQKVFSSNGTISFEVGANLTSQNISSLILVGNSTVNTTINSTSITATKIYANGVFGANNKVLTSNGTAMYWGDSTGGLFTISSQTFVGNNSNTQFTLSDSTTSLETFVFLNGVAQIPTTDYSISGTTLTFVTAPLTTDNIEVRTINIPTISGITFNLDSFVGNGTNTAFTLSTSLSSNTTSFVYLNGVTQVPGTDYTVSGSTLSFTTAPVNLELIKALSVNPTGSYASDSFTANSTVNNNFTLSIPTTTFRSLVFINGVAQAPSIDYIVSGSTLSFTANAAVADVVQVRSFFEELGASGANTTIQYNSSSRLKGSLGFTFNETTNNIAIGNTLTVPNFVLNASNPPANSTSSGTTGTFAWDSSYLYIATGTNTWKKVLITADGSGGGSANTAGSNTEIQFNDNNALGANNKFTFDKSTTTLAIGSNVTINTSAIFIGNSTVNTVITAGTFGTGMSRESFTGNGSNTNFTLSITPINEAQTLVFVDRVLQRDSEYSLSGTTLIFDSAPDASSDIDVYISNPGITRAAGSNTQVVFNDSNTAAGSAGFTFNKDTTTLAIGSNVTVNTSAIFIGNSTVNTTIIAGNVDLQGTQLRVGNVVVNGTQIALGNVTIRTDQISIGNSTVNTVIGQTGSISGNGSLLTSVNAIALQGNSVNDILLAANTAANTLASAAFSNAASRADSAYTNATSYAATIAGTAYTNAASYADTKAGTAYSNATSYAATIAGTAYSNAVSVAATDATTKAGTAYTNATSYADTKAGTAYTNAVAYAASNTYVNSTFLPLAGGTLTGNLTINATANVVGNSSANNATFRGDVQIDGNLTVSGTSVTLNVTNLALEDNMVYLNSGSQVSHPDLGIAGNYNDGSYKHAGFFRDATDGVWKVFDGYTPEPDASAFIDTSNTSFRIANFTANVVTANSFSGNGASVTSVNAATVGSNTAADLRSYSDTIAGTAYSNATSYAATIAGTAYSNAVSVAATDATTKAGTAYTNATSYSANGSNISSGTVAFARLASLYIGTTQVQSSSAAQAVSGITTLAAGNTTITGFANVTSSIQGGSTLTIAGAASGITTLAAGNTTITGFANVTTTLQVGTNTATIGTTLYVVANGNVGIGTSSPSNPLTVTSDTSAQIRIETISANINARLTLAATGTGLNVLGTTGAAPLAFLSGSTTEQMRIDTSGNVGIGTSSPATKLDVLPAPASGTYGGIRVKSATSTDAIGLYQTGSAYTYGSVGSSQSWIYCNYGDLNITSDATGIIKFEGTSGSEKMRLDASGNVGIGTSSPSQKLEVAGNIFVNTSGNPSMTVKTSGAGNNPSYRLQADTNYWDLQGTFSNANDELFFNYNGSTKLAIDNSGNVGIGTTSPAAKLNVEGASALLTLLRNTSASSYTSLRLYNDQNSNGRALEIDYSGSSYSGALVSGGPSGESASITTTGAYPLVFGTSNAARMTIDSSGNVGIGTTGPANKLHITASGLDITSGNAINGTSMQGIRLHNSNNDNSSLGIWFATNNIHTCGITGQRSNYASTWGTDLRFYTHEDATSDLTYSRERMRIDSAGRMSRPYQPAFMVYGTGGNTSYSDGAEFNIGTGIDYNAGNSYNTATGRFTAPVAGFYQFSYGCYAYNGGQLAFKKNGATWTPSDSIGLFSIQPNCIGGTSLYISLAAGDYVSFGWRSGYSGNIYHSHSWFSGHLVG